MDQAEIHVFNRLQEFVRDSCPSAWLEYAEELRDSAELIWTREEDLLGVSLTLDTGHHVLKDKRVSAVSRTYMLLAGFALENVLKGHLVAKKPSLVNEGFLSEELKSHDITGLAAKIPNLMLSKAERSFCDHATKAIPYWGRYPIPLKKNQLSPEIAVDEELRQAFLGLFYRLAHELYWEIRDGWDSGVGPKTLKMRNIRYGDSIDLKESLF